jgi:hypothetical protein
MALIVLGLKFNSESQIKFNFNCTILVMKKYCIKKGYQNDSLLILYNI